MIVPLDAIDAAPSAGRHLAATATHNTRTQVHAAFDVQDTEAWSNADDLRTPSEVKAELARLRQLALACVTAKMDNKKVNDKIDLNARSRRPVVLWCFHFLGWTRGHLLMKWVVSLLILRPFGDRDAPRRRRRRPRSTRRRW